MSTSFSGKINRIAGSLYGNSPDPMDAVITKYGIANNIMHCLDSAAQVRVNAWPAKNLSGNLDPYFSIDGPDFTGDWYLLGGCPMGPWPLTLRADGTPYRLIVQMTGAVSAVAGDATFRVIIAPTHASAIEGLTESSDRVFETLGVSSTSPALLSGSSQGDNASSTYLDVPREMAQEWIGTIDGYDAVSGASPVSIQACMVSAWVFAKTTSTSSAPRLYGLRIAEYCQP